jgi:hypothetical protein
LGVARWPPLPPSSSSRLSPSTPSSPPSTSRSRSSSSCFLPALNGPVVVEVLAAPPQATKVFRSSPKEAPTFRASKVSLYSRASLLSPPPEIESSPTAHFSL